jgi:hypothetical protein
MQNEGPAVHFINVEYFFQLIYSIFNGGVVPADISAGGLLQLLSSLWLALTIIAYLFSLAAIGVFVYATMRLYQVRQDEVQKYATRTPEEEHAEVEHSRWTYIMQLIETGQERDWRQAIIESDIMLDELLTRLGYIGDSLGEKLRGVNPARFQTINNAWEAHKVRNEIAHQGSTFELSEHLAHRTIANYEVVFREHGEI